MPRRQFATYTSILTMAMIGIYSWLPISAGCPRTRDPLFAGYLWSSWARIRFVWPDVWRSNIRHRDANRHIGSLQTRWIEFLVGCRVPFLAVCRS